MAEQTYHQAALQHLAHLQQDSVPHQGASVLQQQAVSEAALEAHLQQQRHQQQALVVVQDLERQRLHQVQQLTQHQAGEQHR
jgi:hypothetical protein